MSIRAIKVHGRKVWQARVAYRGERMSTIRPSKAEAKTAEAALFGKLQARAGQLAQLGGAPATVRGLLESYAERLAARGKSGDTLGRAASTALAVERLMPALLDKPVGAVTDADIFAFRQARLRMSIKPSTVNRDMRTLRAALKAARPEYRFPGGAFFPEDETRVRWLRPDEELLVLEPMPSPFREIAKLAALTLMRQSEIRPFGARWCTLSKGSVLPRRAATLRCYARPERTAHQVRVEDRSHVTLALHAPAPWHHLLKCLGDPSTSVTEKCSALK